MNNMKKLIALCLPAMLLATSCVDSLDDYNIDPKNASKASAAGLFTGAERSLTRIVSSSSVNENPFRFYVQYWTETTYPDETNYDISTRPIPGTFWNRLYRDDLRNLEEAKTIINASSLDAKVKANQLAAIEVLEVYSWSVLVNTFGNVPYSEALDFTKAQPKYDDAATIYADIISRLNVAITKFDPSAESFGSADLIYQGDVTNWIKFANSLKLRLGMTLADVDPAKSKTMVAESVSKVFTSSADNADVAFTNSFPNANPVWEDLVQSGRKDFVGADTFIDTLNYLNDPRRPSYFKARPDGSFIGGTYGAANNYSTFSAPGVKQEDPTHPGLLLSYSEVEFLLAEAAARGGYSVTGTADSHYNTAITTSIQDEGGSAADATTYLAQPSVAYATAIGSTPIKRIGFQKWISLYDQPVESYKEWRRLDSPALFPGDDALSAIPLRFKYPVIEQNLNTANYNAASTAIGGDKVTTKIFWDKF
jgi:hypothetical protein